MAVWEIPSTLEGLIGVFNVAEEANSEQYIKIPNLLKGNYDNLFVDICVNELLDDEFHSFSGQKWGIVCAYSSVTL